MPDHHLNDRIAELEAEIAESDGDTRAVLLSQLERVLHRLEMEGVTVARHQIATRERQEDDAVEAQFDNLPV